MTIEHGASAANQTLDWAHEFLGLDWAEIAAAIGADRRTISRWRLGRSAPRSRHRDRIEDVRVVRVLLETVFPNESARLEWLNEPLPLLRGRSPISLMRTARLEDVIGVLAGLESGSFS